MEKRTKSSKNQKEGVMKKLIVVGLVAVLAMFAGSVAQAALVTTQPVTVLMSVNDEFGFYTDKTSVTIASIAGGDTAFGDVNITAYSNHTVPWMIKASSAGVLGEGNAAGRTLPIQMSTIIGAGTKVDHLVLNGSAQTVYTAASSEYPKAAVALSAQIFIPTTVDTASGCYAGSVTFTMTE